MRLQEGFVRKLETKTWAGDILIGISTSRTVLINGNGAFQLNIQELETLHRLGLPIKIFIWCNTGYASIQNMQRNNFGRLVGSGPESGFTVPDICKVAEAYGLKNFRIKNNRELESMLQTVLDLSRPVRRFHYVLRPCFSQTEA